MKKVRLVFIGVLILVALPVVPAFAQDPSFSQFFSSPLNVDPALTGNINADWRLISNIRNQWMGSSSPYVTGTVSFDTKLLTTRIANIPEGNYFGVGSML